MCVCLCVPDVVESVESAKNEVAAAIAFAVLQNIVTNPIKRRMEIRNKCNT